MIRDIWLRGSQSTRHSVEKVVHTWTNDNIFPAATLAAVQAVVQPCSSTEHVAVKQSPRVLPQSQRGDPRRRALPSAVMSAPSAVVPVMVDPLVISEARHVVVPQAQPQFPYVAPPVHHAVLNPALHARSHVHIPRHGLPMHPHSGAQNPEQHLMNYRRSLLESVPQPQVPQVPTTAQVLASKQIKIMPANIKVCTATCEQYCLHRVMFVQESSLQVHQATYWSLQRSRVACLMRMCGVDKERRVQHAILFVNSDWLSLRDCTY